MAFLGVFAVILALLFVVAATGFKLVRQWELGLIERFGRYEKTVGPGLPSSTTRPQTR
jgi:regulator of protease activity HflC (stomatin/prohibitin superfamily)